MKKLFSWLPFSMLLFASFWMNANAQDPCQKWTDTPRQEEAEEAHVLYRQFLKNENYDEAFKYWQKAYELAPAADGQRPFHYMDGRDFYMRMFQKETDEAKKKEYAATILRLYDEQMRCYGNENLLMGLKVYDMFYTLRTPYPELLKTLKQAVEKGGNNTAYTILEPYAHVLAFQFKNKQMDVEEARKTHILINEIADYNIANNKEYGAYYQQAKDRLTPVLGEVEGDIFDCAFFIAKFEPLFRANHDDYEAMKYYYNKMVQQGCDESNPFVAEVKAHYEEIVSQINAEKLAAFYVENPGAHAKALYDEGKYNEALDKYEEAIKKEEGKGAETDNEVIGSYYFSMASILGRKLDRYSAGRDYALKAARLRPNWGQPYMLIGDLYAESSSSCGGEAWDHHIAVLAAIEKYAYARSIDSNVADEANEKIARYSKFKPQSEEAFMRGVQAGASVKVPCWIGETVRVSFQ
ncbi:MAG: hypothetical protein IPL49_20215 [Saprospirales bacterium]|nr:hypothetical protein [Saprospirales bacterium]